MKILKNVAILVLVLVCVLCINNKSFAKTVIVTTDGLNLRREASTDSEVMDIISINEEVEYVDEQGNWYKVKYKGMTGYVSKDFAKIKNEETTNNAQTNTTAPNNNQNTDNNENVTNNGNTTTSQNTNSNENTNSGENTNSVAGTNSTENSNTQANTTTNTGAEANNSGSTSTKSSTYMKIKEDTVGCILPLINANVISNFKKDSVVKTISVVNGWAYIESETTTAWVRTSKLEDIQNGTQTPETNSNAQNPDNTNTQQPTNSNNGDPKDENPENPDLTGQIEVTPMEPKIMYVQESSIYVRSGPGTTYDVVDTLIANNSVTVTGKINDWYQVKIEDKVGYIADWLLGNTKKEITSRGNVERDFSAISNENNVTTSSSENSVTTSNNNTESNGENEKNDATSTSTETISKGEQIVNYAKQYLGCKYVYGGSGPNVFDCSGFTMYVYKNFGVSLSHSATAQSKKGTYVAKEDLMLGDLVFFKDYETMDGIGHCGIYIGGGEFIHASSGTGYCVKISTLLSGSYSTRYETARRVI